MKALIDTCIMIDALQAREPFFDDAENLLIAAANGEYEGVISSKSILDIYYLIHRYTKSDSKTRDYISKILRLFEVCDTTADDVEKAVLSDISDYEDAVMSMTAKRVCADVIVTRNIKDFSKSKVTAILPSDFLLMLDGEEGDR